MNSEKCPLIDQIKLLAEGHSGIIDRLSRIDGRLDRMEKENERQHLETRALVKISFSELDRRVSDLESQVKDLQEWKKQVQSRLQS
jgi:predicted  nucleic acid-binding Zn-ribbon protein